MGGGRIDDAAPFLRLHARNGGAYRVKRRREVDGDDRVPLLGRKFLDRRDELDAGVVDQNAERTHFALGVGDHRLDLRPFRHVGRVVERLDAEFLLDLDALALDRRLVAKSVDDDVRPFFGESAGDGEPDAAGRTGDEGVTVGKRHRLFSFRPRGGADRAWRSYCIAMKLSSAVFGAMAARDLSTQSA